MRKILLVALAALAALSLAGCYVTTKPLITAANAAWPIPAGTAFKSFSWKEETNAWEESGRGTLMRVGDQYRLRPAPDPGQTSDPEDEVDFLLTDIGGGYYAAQARNKDDGNFLLDIAKIEGNVVYQYVLMCEPEDKQLADTGVIDSFEPGDYVNSCSVSSLAQLKRAFQTKLAAGMVPKGKYEF